MRNRTVLSNLGAYIYAAAAIFLGIIGLVSGDFAGGWQHVGQAVPLREALAYAAALIELAAGVALLVPHTARKGAVALTIVYAVFTLLWVPKALIDVFKPDFDAMGNVFEEFSMVAAGLVLCAMYSARGSALAQRERLFARMFGLCPVSFGIVHIFDTMPGIAGFTPKWLPPSPLFWAYATTICFFLAAAAILTGFAGLLAARLLTAEIVGFQFLVWIPALSAKPRMHFNWAANAINLAIAASAWVVADSIGRARKLKPMPAKSSAEVGSLA